MTIIASVYAEVVELVDTLDLGSSASRRESSSLSFRTKLGYSQVGKAAGFDPAIHRFESCYPSHILEKAALLSGFFVCTLVLFSKCVLLPHE